MAVAATRGLAGAEESRRRGLSNHQRRAADVDAESTGSSGSAGGVVKHTRRREGAMAEGEQGEECAAAAVRGWEMGACGGGGGRSGGGRGSGGRAGRKTLTGRVGKPEVEERKPGV